MEERDKRRMEVREESGKEEMDERKRGREGVEGGRE